MNIDIDKYPVRRSNPIVVGSYGLPKDTERYVIKGQGLICLLYTSPSPRDKRQSRMPSSA